MFLRRFWLALLLFVPHTLSASDARSVAIARLTTDMKFFASDQCEGRGPGTDGINLAANHIANIFKESGLQPAMPDGSYFQPFTVKGQARIKEPTALSIVTSEATIAPKVSAGFVPLALGSDGKVAGGVVFVGFGITAPEQSYDDYADVNVEGKIVLMLRRLPRYADKDKPFADDETIEKLASIAAKAENAANHKAAAVLLVNDSTSVDESNDDISGFANLKGKSVGIPVIHIKRHLAASLIKPAFGKTLGDIEEKISKDLKPVSKVLADCSANLEVTIDRNPINVKNVVGVLPGAGPLADETIILGAHYDHLGYGGSGSFNPQARKIHYGADDNASGTTSLCELARRLGSIENRQGRRLVFIAFTGEEINLLGSAHYCKEPIFPLDKTVAMLNMDMVGRMQVDKETQKGKIKIGGTGTAKQFDAMLNRLGDKHELLLEKSTGGTGPSDHQSFFLKGLPVLFFFSGLHTDYHRPSDTWDKINFEGMSQIVDLVDDLTRELMVLDPRPEFVKVVGGAMDLGRARRGPKLGVMPNYGDEGPGMLLEGVTPGGAAEEAKLQAGDRIVEIAGKEIKDVQGYMSAMGKAKAGEALELVILRGKDRINVTVTPK